MDQSNPIRSGRRPPRDLVEVKFELGRVRNDRGELPGLSPGSTVQLDTLVSDLLDIIADGRLVARGEAMVMDGKLCVRVIELVGTGSRLAADAA